MRMRKQSHGISWHGNEVEFCTEEHSKPFLIAHLALINAIQDPQLYEQIITDRHPNPLFSVCIISPNAERKILQTNCVRKTGAVFFGSREIIRGNLKRAKSTRSIIETRSIIKPKTSCIIRNNAGCFSFNNAACFTCIYPLPTYFFLLTRNNHRHHKKYF